MNKHMNINDTNTVFIGKGNIVSHYIQPTTIISDQVKIKLSLIEENNKTKSFYI